MEGLKRIKANTVEKHLLKSNGDPNFNISFYVLNANGQYAGVSMYGPDGKYAICTENGAQVVPFDVLLAGSPTNEE